jgi:hypothetical protein
MKKKFLSGQRVDHALLGLIVLSLVTLHLILGMNFPLTQADEGSFLFPSVAFADHFQFYTRSLLIRSDPLWMPPGYYVIAGLILNLVDIFALSPLFVVRFLSLMFVAASVVLIFHSFRLVRVSSATAILCIGLSALLPPIVCIANLGRMEALLLMLFTLSLLQYFRGKFWSWIGIVALAPLIHPNGFWLIFAALPKVILMSRRQSIKRPDMGDIWIFAIFIFWMAYLWYIRHNWSEFWIQMDMQFARKIDRNFLESITRPSNVAALLLWLVWWWRTRRDRRKIIESLCCYEVLVLLGMIMTFVVGMEVWYRSFWCVAVLYMLACLFDDWKWTFSESSVRLLALIVILAGPFLFLKLPWTWGGMEIRPNSKMRIVRDAICPNLNSRFSNQMNKVLVSTDPIGETVLLLDCIPTRDSRKNSGWAPYSPILGDKPQKSEKSIEISIK